MHHYPPGFYGETPASLPEEVTLHLDECLFDVGAFYIGTSDITAQIDVRTGAVMGFARWSRVGSKSSTVAPYVNAHLRAFVNAWIATAEGQRAIQKAIDNAIGE
jgi:hypothetical protein